MCDEEYWKKRMANKKERRKILYNDNLDFLIENMAGRFQIKETVLLFRENGKPKVDFYPHTGRWRVPDKNELRSGGAEDFLNWYDKQKI